MFFFFTKQTEYSLRLTQCLIMTLKVEILKWLHLYLWLPIIRCMSQLRVIKGYIHDCHHAPARLNAEAIRLQISIWNTVTVVHQSVSCKWQKSQSDRFWRGLISPHSVARVGIAQVVEGCSGEFKVALEITCWSVYEQLLILNHQWTTTHHTHRWFCWEI